MRALFLPTVLLVAMAGCQATIAVPTPAASVATQASQAPAATPTPAATATPAPAATADPAQAACMADFDAFNVNKDTMLSYDEYVDGKYGKIRWFKAPTDKEVADMKASLKAEAEKADADKDGKLTRDEYKATCAQP